MNKLRNIYDPMNSYLAHAYLRTHPHTTEEEYDMFLMYRHRLMHSIENAYRDRLETFYLNDINNKKSRWTGFRPIFEESSDDECDVSDNDCTDEECSDDNECSEDRAYGLSTLDWIHIANTFLTGCICVRLITCLYSYI